jgi:hypothetical protein
MTEQHTPAEIAAVLGAAQRRVLLSLSEEWGKACDHQAAKRMFYGVRGRGGLRLNRYYYLVEHKHRTDNCWRLSTWGSAVRAAIVDTQPKAGDVKQAPLVSSDGAGNGNRPNLRAA